MKASRLRIVIFGMMFFLLLLAWTPVVAFGADGDDPSYEVVGARIMYLPEMPLHITDLRYPDKSDFETRTVEVLQPRQDGQPLQNRPVIFYVHGGGWVNGYAQWYTDVLTPALVAEQGWVVVNVDYRLTSDQVYLADEQCPSYDDCDPARATKAAWYDDNIRDVAAAFDWTVAHISEYGGDARNIFLFGHSAGGHLVSLLATHEDYRTYRPHIRGVISLSGVYNLNTVNYFAYPLLDQTFRGGHTDVEALAGASPETYVRPGERLPPFFILHCQYDLPSLPAQAIAFRNQLEAVNSDVRWQYLPGYDHSSEMSAISDGEEAVTQSIIRYVRIRSGQQIYAPLIY